MLKHTLAALCTLAALGIGYTALATTSQSLPQNAPLLTDAPTTAPAAVDLKNTKCPSTLEDTTGGPTYTYQGKIYHFCCPDCIKDFKKDPAKFVKAIEKDPAKYGIKANTK